MSYAYLIERYRRMLAARGYALTKQSKILDFCCGSGGYVRCFRDMGYDICGFEPFADLAPADDPAFASLDWPNPYKPENYRIGALPDLKVDWRQRGFRLPYPDATFDFVFSTEVMEHVSDHDAALSELRRVMKPDAVAIHSFPARYRPMEPHIGVPFGAVLKNYLWYRAWLAIRPKNPWPVQFSRSDLARMAIWYATRGGLNYLTPKQIAHIGKKHFERSSFVPELWEADSPKGPPRLRWLYTRTRNVIWMLERPRH